MAVFIKDTLGIWLRRIVVWSLLLVLGCIDYTHADLGTITITAAGTPLAGTRFWKVDKDGSKELTCADTTGDGNQFEVVKRSSGSASGIGFGWSDKTVGQHTVLDFKASDAGKYTCQARESTKQTFQRFAEEPLTLALNCTVGGKECGDSRFFECDTDAQYCRCKKNPTEEFPNRCDLLGNVTIEGPAGRTNVANTRIWTVPNYFGHDSATLTCNDTTGLGDQFRFLKAFLNGYEPLSAWSTTPTHTVSDFNGAKTGEYTCEARQTYFITMAAKEPLTLALECHTTQQETCTTWDKFAQCAGANTVFYCQCTVTKAGAGTFPTCYECVEDGDCTKDENKKKCSPSALNFNGIRKCVACLGAYYNSGCDPTSAAPRCDVSGPEPVCAKCETNDNGIDFGCQDKTETCNVTSGKCEKAPTSSATDATTGAPCAPCAPSSAGKVTSTASMFIASVVVALLN